MAMKEAYVKRVIEVFKLKPKDLGTTPQYFCDVFEFCDFLPSTTTTTSKTTTTMETTSTFAGESLISTISNTTTMASSVLETTTKTTEQTIPTTSVKTTSKIPADRIEVQPEVDHTEVVSDMKELESKVEDKYAEAKASGTEVALEKIAGRRSDNLNPGVVFHGTDESEQEVEASVPKVKASIEVQSEVDPTEVESDLKELESKVEASEDKDAEAKASGTEVALEKIADKRSDNLNPGIVFHGTDASEQEVELSVPKVKALTGSEVDSEPEKD
jgi:hypothetical protein